MKALARYITVLIFISFNLLSFSQNEEWTLDNNSIISVITCSPGSEIYSMYGHTAIRVKGSLKGKKIDWIYNYGTFEFTDDFEVKFARGKLNYTLSKEEFPAFQYSYLVEERAVYEQVLRINEQDKQKLFEALEENYLPENRTYLYDFFYNNCSTKVRDILKDVLGNELHYDTLNVSDKTFRDYIKEYRGQFPWTEFGIDLALGLPCDKVVGPTEEMFLPDYLMKNLENSTLGDNKLILSEKTLLLSQDQESEDIIWTPVAVMWLFAIISGIFLTLLFLRKKHSKILYSSVMFLTGILGLCILLLWVATDHTATAWNMNLIWANPLNLIFAFIPNKRYSAVYSIALAALILLFAWLPQALHPATIPLMLTLLMANVLFIKIVR